MRTLQGVLTGAHETEAVGAAVARRLSVGDVVLLSGELGAGKTTFVRGAVAALGCSEPVTSPTFTIGHRYPGTPDVSHLDLYRFTGLSNAEWGDLEPYFDDAVVFVEWPEAGQGVVPTPRVLVTLEHATPTTRAIRLESEEVELLDVIADADPRLRHLH